MRSVLTTALAMGLFFTCSHAEANGANPTAFSEVSPLSEVCPEQLSTQSAATNLPDSGCGGDPGGDPGGGGSPPAPPFSPPAMAYPQEILPGVLVNPFLYQTCQQFPHMFTGFSNDVPRGTTLYLSGIVAPATHAVYGFYNQFGQLADVQMTNASKSNCVIHHDENPFDTSGLAPGYYTVYANYVTISPPGAPPIFGGYFPPGFNFYVTVNGYQNSHSMRHVTTIRIR